MEKLTFDEKLPLLAKELDGKVLRKEWSKNRDALKKKYVMSTRELHRAFGLIGSGKASAGKPRSADFIKNPRNKDEWQAAFKAKFGTDPDKKLTIPLLKEALKDSLAPEEPKEDPDPEAPETPTEPNDVPGPKVPESQEELKHHPPTSETPEDQILEAPEE